MKKLNAAAARFALDLCRYYPNVYITARYDNDQGRYIVTGQRGRTADPFVIASLATVNTEAAFMFCVQSLHDKGHSLYIEITKRTRPNASPIYTLLGTRAGHPRRCKNATAEMFLNNAWADDASVKITYSTTLSLVSFNDKVEHFCLGSF